jgi:hypothetical protein
MDGAAMSLELHGCGIHAVWFGAGETSVTEVRFSSVRLQPIARCDRTKTRLTGYTVLMMLM